MAKKRIKFKVKGKKKKKHERFIQHKKRRGKKSWLGGHPATFIYKPGHPCERENTDCAES